MTPTSEQVGRYLLATGWSVHPASDTDPRGWLIWVKGDQVERLPKEPGEDYGRRLERLLTVVAYIEGRPSPAEQVAADILDMPAAQPRLELDPTDLVVETFRGLHQGVNQPPTGVQVTHLPTGKTATSTVERSKSANLAKAMQDLTTRLSLLAK